MPSLRRHVAITACAVGLATTALTTTGLATTASAVSRPSPHASYVGARGQVLASAVPMLAGAAHTGCGGRYSDSVQPTTIRVYRVALRRVEVVPFKDYVKNVLPNEWIPSWRPASLQAGAMAVKEFGWYWTNHSGNRRFNGQCFDVSDNTSSQVYQPGSALANTSAAVEATWDTRMTRSGKIVEAHYCSRAGACGAWTTGDWLSQYGSQSQAAAGSSYAAILASSYAGTSFAQISTPPMTGPLSVSGFGDLNHDGTPDQIGYDPATARGNLQIAWGTADPAPWGSGWNQFRGLLRGDFDGDGTQEIIGVTTAGSLIRYQFAAAGKLVSKSLLRGSSGWSALSRYAVVNDLGRSRAQRMVGIASNGDLSYYGATQVVVSRALVPTSVFTQVTQAGDINADGVPDLIAVSSAGSVTALYGHSNGTYSKGAVVARGWARFRSVNGGGDGRVAAVDAATGVLYTYQVTSAKAGGVRLLSTTGAGWNRYTGLL